MRSESSHEVMDRIRLEHEALRDQLRHIQQLLTKHPLPGNGVAGALHDFQSALLDHFWNEENNGFFDEVASQAPNLTPSAHKLCAEHQEMVHAVAELTRFAQAGSHSETWWRELKSRFQAFGKRLMHHESEESTLLQMAYQKDVGTHD
jgi:iron-sulfur cluster repair protein YtfE (RIC family)